MLRGMSARKNDRVVLKRLHRQVDPGELGVWRQVLHSVLVRLLDLVLTYKNLLSMLMDSFGH